MKKYFNTHIFESKITKFNPYNQIILNKYQKILAKNIFDEERTFIMLQKMFRQTENINTQVEYIEVSKNIFVDRVEHQKTGSKVSLLKVQDRFIMTNKSFVLNKEIMQKQLAKLQIKEEKSRELFEVSKNIFVDRVEHQKTGSKVSLLKVEDRFIMSNKFFVLNKEIMQNIAEKKNIKNVPKNRDVKTFESDSFSLNYVKTKRIKKEEKENILPKVKEKKDDIRLSNKKKIYQKVEPLKESIMPILIKNRINQEMPKLETMIEEKFKVELYNFNVNIDSLATRIFNDLKEEIDIGYRI
jgi:hypothetical protein